MADHGFATLGAGKLLSRKVAVVTDALSPLGEAFCVQFVREGASVLLVDGDFDGANAMAADINLLGGLDPNYGDIGNDPWGSCTKAVAVQMDCLSADMASELIVTSVNSFGQSPDVVVDVNSVMDSEFTRALSNGCRTNGSKAICSREGGKQMATVLKNDADKSLVVTVSPFTDRDVFLPGWLGVLDPSTNDVDSIELDGQSPRLHILCSESNARFLARGQAPRQPLQAGHCNIEVRCSKVMLLLSWLTSGVMGGARFKLVDWENGGGHAAGANDDPSELVMSVNMEMLDPAVEDEPVNESNGEYETTFKGPPSPRSPLPETIVSRAILGRPFDACLQKNDGYPEDVWGIMGNRDIEKPEALRVLDDDCVLSIARSSVNCSVRWLLFGYIVIMVAVPRVLGGLSVGI